MICSSWEIECERLKLVIMGIFLPLDVPHAPHAPPKKKNQNFEKLKKNILDISSFYTCVLKNKIIWCMASKIWSMGYRMFCHFGPFSALLSPKNLENQNLEKMKKIPGDIYIIILHKYPKNNDYMLYMPLRYGAWRMQFVFFLLGYF